jgi:hypothetical protein
MGSVDDRWQLGTGLLQHPKPKKLTIIPPDLCRFPLSLQQL